MMKIMLKGKLIETIGSLKLKTNSVVGQNLKNNQKTIKQTKINEESDNNQKDNS